MQSAEGQTCKLQANLQGAYVYYFFVAEDVEEARLAPLLAS